MTADYYVIKLARFERGWTQAEAAKAAGISLATYTKAERGRDISAATHGKIKRALGVK